MKVVRSTNSYTPNSWWTKLPDSITSPCKLQQTSVASLHSDSWTLVIVDHNVTVMVKMATMMITIIMKVEYKNFFTTQHNKIGYNWNVKMSPNNKVRPYAYVNITYMHVGMLLQKITHAYRTHEYKMYGH